MRENLWDALTKQFTFMTTRTVSGDAAAELVIMAVVAFLLGFLFCYVQGKSRD